ncbi:hypothetical protein MRY87_03115 [bacterium]|nr:hypothetical protein [bacterium]
MTRIPENYISRSLLVSTLKNKADVARYGEEISTGYKVAAPGDSNFGSTISQMRSVLEEIEGQESRVSNARGFLERQDAVYGELNDALIRANEIAAQGANETNSAAERAQLSKEVFEIRSQVVNLANSQYLGRYIFAGNADHLPAFETNYSNAQFSDPATAPENEAFAYTTETDANSVRSVPVTNELSVQVNEDGSQVFREAIRGLTELGRSLAGYQTVWTSTDPLEPDPAQSVAYTLPSEYTQQTDDIQAALDRIESARETDVIPARTEVAGRMRRLQSAESLLGLSKTSAENILIELQQADVVESATRLTEAQTALNASLTVTTQLLRQSILDFL